MKNRHVFVRVSATLVAAVLILPTLVVVPISFAAKPSFIFPPEGFSLIWYEKFFGTRAWSQAFTNSILIASLACVVAVVIGTAAAVGLYHLRSQSRLRDGLRTTLLLPIVVPGIVLAVGIYLVFSALGLVGTIPGFVIAHAMLGCPFVVVSVGVSLASLDSDLERAAAGLGASAIATFRSIVLPAITPGIVTGALFAFVTSFDEVLLALFIKSPFLETLPVRMYTSISTSIDPTIAAASTIVLAFTTLLFAVVGAFVLLRNRRLRETASLT